MFAELMPMLSDRTVLITVARLDDSNIQVNVVPKKAKDGENDALTTPLSFTGTPAELDAGMGPHVASYVDAHVSLGNSLSQAKATMDAVAKAEKDAADGKKKAAIKKGVVVKAEPAKTASLFDQPTTGGDDPDEDADDTDGLEVKE